MAACGSAANGRFCGGCAGPGASKPKLAACQRTRAGKKLEHTERKVREKLALWRENFNHKPVRNRRIADLYRHTIETLIIRNVRRHANQIDGLGRDFAHFK